MKTTDEKITITFHQLKPKLFSKHFVMCVVGQNQSGKSYFVKKLYRKKMKDIFDRVLVFTDSQDMVQEYLDMDTGAEIHQTSEIENMTFEGKKKDMIGVFDKIEEENSDKKQKILIIIDDYYPKDISKDVNIGKLFTQSAHINVSVIYICQYIYKMISGIMKNNAQYYVFFRNEINSRIWIRNKLADVISNINVDLDKKQCDSIANQIYHDECLTKKYGKVIVSYDSFYHFK